MRQILVPHLIKSNGRGSHRRAGRVVRLDGQSMGTTWSVKLVSPAGRGLDEVRRCIEFELDRVVAQMSTWQASSTISAYNALPPGSWQEIECEFWTVLVAALETARNSGGAYDPTIGELTELWGFGASAPPAEEPSAAWLCAAVGRCGCSRVELDSSTRRILQPGGLRLDLSSIAKGFAVDQVARRLLSIGCSDFLVEAGGELRGEGSKPDGSPWWVLLERPPAREGCSECTVPETLLALHGLAVATSGNYRRRAHFDGRWHSHTLDPRTGIPVSNDLMSVSVVAPDCMIADAWATALMALGADAGSAFAERHNIAARFVVHEGAALRERMSSEMVAMLG